MSVNYPLAPENPLLVAYNDGLKSVMWLKEQALNKEINELLLKNCNFSGIYLAGDSAGANIVHNVSIKLELGENVCSLGLKGRILIQPFFGGEIRTNSEEYIAQPPGSALSLAVSDTYWQLLLPLGSDRDHQWSNPVAKGSSKLGVLPTLVCMWVGYFER